MIKRLEHMFETILFGSRWLLAPFYLGMVGGLFILLAVFLRELFDAVLHVAVMTVETSILKLLTLLDLTLAANLVVVVILAGYENFVSKINTDGHEDRPGWMGTTSFSGLKLKLFASIVAISGIQLLKLFMALSTGAAGNAQVMWMTIIHLAFVVTALLSAITDYTTSHCQKH
ncbi:TIGR00645 family protein [uncultured Sphingomonas sp.]|uniref:TIGR00645 family protein n=1 Tax=uncultured Sphingomonas sp. TaxID=158754 RepID=UPI0035CB3A08